MPWSVLVCAHSHGFVRQSDSRTGSCCARTAQAAEVAVACLLYLACRMVVRRVFERSRAAESVARCIVNVAWLPVARRMSRSVAGDLHHYTRHMAVRESKSKLPSGVSTAACLGEPDLVAAGPPCSPGCLRTDTTPVARAPWPQHACSTSGGTAVPGVLTRLFKCRERIADVVRAEPRREERQ